MHKPIETLIQVEEYIVAILNAFFNKDNTVFNNLLSSPSIFNKGKWKALVNPTVKKSLLLFYKSIYDIVHRTRIVQHQFAVLQYGLSLPFGGQELHGISNTPEAIGKQMQLAIHQLLEIKRLYPSDWDELIKKPALRQSIFFQLHILITNEDEWGLIDELTPLLDQLKNNSPAESKQEDIIHLNVDDLLCYLIERLTNNKNKSEMDLPSNGLAFETNYLRKLRLSLLNLDKCSPKEAVDTLDKLELPLVFTRELPHYLIEYLQMDLAYLMIKALNAKCQDEAFLLFYIHLFSTLNYFPSWMTINLGSGHEASVFNVTRSLEIHLRALKNCSLVFENSNFSMCKQLYTLYGYLLTHLPKTVMAEPSKELEELALSILASTKQVDYFTNAQEDCLFLLRPLQILVKSAEKEKTSLGKMLTLDLRKHLAKRTIKSLRHKTWLALDRVDQDQFLIASAYLLSQNQTNQHDASAISIINPLVIELCERYQLKEALILLAARLENKREASLSPHYQQDLSFFHLLHFLHILPAEITDTELPTILEKRGLLFMNEIKYTASSVIIGLKLCSSMFANFSPLDKPLVHKLKDLFFSKTNFLEFQMHLFYFLYNHKEDRPKTATHLVFKNVLMQVAAILGDKNDIAQLEARLSHLPDYMKRQELPANASEGAGSSLKPYIAVSLVESQLARLFRQMDDQLKKLLDQGAQAIQTDHLPLIAAYRFYNLKNHKYTEEELFQNECLTLFYAKIIKLMNLSVEHLPSGLMDRLSCFIQNGFEEQKPRDRMQPKEIHLDSLVENKGMAELKSQGLEIKLDCQQAIALKQATISILPQGDFLESAHHALRELFSNLIHTINYMKQQIALKNHLLSNGIGLRALQHCLFFYVLHEHLLPETNQEVASLIALLLEAKLKPNEKYFLEYVDALNRGLDRASIRDNPFLNAYDLVNNAMVLPLQPLDYTDIPSFWAHWNQLFLMRSFLIQQLKLKSFDEKSLTEQLKQGIVAKYFPDCDLKDPHLLSFLNQWKKLLLSLGANYHFIHDKYNEATKGHFFVFAETLSLLNYISMLWYNQLKVETVSSDKQSFVFANASDFLRAKFKLPKENKKEALKLLVKTCLRIERDQSQFSQLTNKDINKCIDSLLEEDLYQEAADILGACLHGSGTNQLIPKAEIKAYQFLNSLFEAIAALNQGSAIKQLESSSFAFHQIQDDFLKKHFIDLSKDRLKEIFIAKKACKSFLQAIDPNLMERKKKKTKKTISKPSLLPAETEPVKAAEVVEEEMQETILAPATAPFSIETNTSSPTPCLVQTEPSTQASHSSAEEDKHDAPQPSDNSSLRGPALPEMKTSASPQRLFAPTRTSMPIALYTVGLVNVKPIPKESFPTSFIKLLHKIRDLNANNQLALVGASLTDLLYMQPGKKLLAQYFSKLLILTDQDNPSAALVQLADFLKKSSFVLEARIASKSIRLSLENTEPLRFEIEFLKQTKEYNPEAALLDYMQDKIFNLDCLCLPLWPLENPHFFLKGTRQTLSSLHKKEISLANRWSIVFERKASAMLLLARHELQFSLLNFKRSPALCELVVANLGDCISFILSTPPDSANYELWLDSLKYLFSWPNLMQIIFKMNELRIIEAITGINYYHIQQSMHAVKHFPYSSDYHTNIKNFSLFLYAHLCFTNRLLLQENPQCLKLTLLMQFINQNLAPADRCSLEIIEDWVTGRESTVLVSDQNFFCMLTQVHAYYNDLLQRQQLVYSQPYGHGYLFWQNPPSLYGNTDYGMYYSTNPYQN